MGEVILLGRAVDTRGDRTTATVVALVLARWPTDPSTTIRDARG
jgi:hypothetical protein